MSTPKPVETQIDWERVEADYRAGLMSIREIARRANCSHTAVALRAEQGGWTRDLKAKIHAKAEAQLAKSVLSKNLATGKPETEKAIIAANANVVAAVHIAHRAGTTEVRELVLALVAEAKAAIHAPEVFAQVYDILASGDDPERAKLRELADLITSLPARAKVMKDLLECLSRVVTIERLAYGLDDKQKSAEDADSFETLRDLAAGG